MSYLTLLQPSMCRNLEFGHRMYNQLT